MLIKLGFLNYVTQQKSAGETMLFSGLKWDKKNGYWAQGSKWFDKYLIGCGVKDRTKDKNKLCHHSFRHTLKHHLKEKNVRIDWANHVVGHTNGSDYDDHEINIKLLSEEVIEKIDFGLDFSHLMNSRKNPYFSAGNDVTAAFP